MSSSIPISRNPPPSNPHILPPTIINSVFIVTNQTSCLKYLMSSEKMNILSEPLKQIILIGGKINPKLTLGNRFQDSPWVESGIMEPLCWEARGRYRKILTCSIDHCMQNSLKFIDVNVVSRHLEYELTTTKYVAQFPGPEKSKYNLIQGFSVSYHITGSL